MPTVGTWFSVFYFFLLFAVFCYFLYSEAVLVISLLLSKSLSGWQKWIIHIKDNSCLCRQFNLCGFNWYMCVDSALVITAIVCVGALVRMFLYLCAFMCVPLCMCVFSCVHVSLCVCMCLCMPLYMRLCVLLCVCVCEYVCVFSNFTPRYVQKSPSAT